jgi:hypothetical protein
MCACSGPPCAPFEQAAAGLTSIAWAFVVRHHAGIVENLLKSIYCLFVSITFAETGEARTRQTWQTRQTQQSVLDFFIGSVFLIDMFFSYNSYKLPFEIGVGFEL